MEFTLHWMDIFGIAMAAFAVGLMLGHWLGKVGA
jgi:hypothetical protein